MTNRKLSAAIMMFLVLGAVIYFGARELGFSLNFKEFAYPESRLPEPNACQCQTLIAIGEKRAREVSGEINWAVIGADSAKALYDSLTRQNEAPPFDEFVRVETRPKPLNLTEIQKCISLPPAISPLCFEGRLIFRVLIDEQGRYVKHVVLRSPHPSLTAAAEKKIVCLRFSPAIQAGKPIKFWTNVPVATGLTP